MGWGTPILQCLGWQQFFSFLFRLFFYVFPRQKFFLRPSSSCPQFHIYVIGTHKLLLLFMSWSWGAGPGLPLNRGGPLPTKWVGSFMTFILYYYN